MICKHTVSASCSCQALQLKGVTADFISHLSKSGDHWTGKRITWSSMVAPCSMRSLSPSVQSTLAASIKACMLKLLLAEVTQPVVAECNCTGVGRQLFWSSDHLGQMLSTGRLQHVHTELPFGCPCVWDCSSL